MPSVRVVGWGRAGSSLAGALSEAGWDVRDPVSARTGPVAGAAAGVDLAVLAVPDSAIAAVAAKVEPDPTAVVAHLAGSLGTEVLGPHLRRAAIHPLTSLPDAAVGARRLRSGCWFAVAGDELALRVVADLGGRVLTVADADRAAYHAAAAVASNHLVALLGQAERIAARAGAPFEAFLDLVRATVDNVAELGPAAALTGPAARGDDATVARHLEAIDPAERAAYEAMAEQARRLARR